MTNEQKTTLQKQLHNLIKDHLKNDNFYIKQIEKIHDLRQNENNKRSKANFEFDMLFKKIREEKKFLHKTEEEQKTFNELNAITTEATKKIDILDRAIKYYNDQRKLLYDVASYSVMFFVFNNAENTRDFNILKGFCDYDQSKGEYKEPIRFSIYGEYFHYYNCTSNKDFVVLPVKLFEAVSIEKMHELSNQYDPNDEKSPFYNQHRWQEQYVERIKPLKKYDYVLNLCEKVINLENKQKKDLETFQSKQDEAKRKLNNLEV